MKAAYDLLATEGKIVGKPKNRFTNPKPSGYRDIILFYKSADGSVSELQFHIPEMIYVKDNPIWAIGLSGHDLYKLWADFQDAGDVQSAAQIRAIELAIHDEALKHFQERTGTLSGDPLSSEIAATRKSTQLDIAELNARIAKRLKELPFPKRR